MHRYNQFKSIQRFITPLPVRALLAVVVLLGSPICQAVEGPEHFSRNLRAEHNPSQAISKSLGMSLFDIAASVGGEKQARRKLVALITPTDETEAFTRLQNQSRERDEICSVPGAKKLNCAKDMSAERESMSLLSSARQKYLDHSSSALDSAGSSYLWILYVTQVKAERLVFEPWVKDWSARCQTEKTRFELSCREEKKRYGKSVDDFLALTATLESASKKGQATVPKIEKNYEAYRD